MREYRGSEGRVVVEDNGDLVFYFEGFMASMKKQGSPRRVARDQVLRAEVVPPRGVGTAYFRVFVEGESERGEFNQDSDLSTLRLKDSDQVQALRPLAAELSGEVIPTFSAGVTPGRSASGMRDDIAAAVEVMGRRMLGAQEEIKQLEDHLLPGEVVVHLGAGRHEGDNGLVAVTSSRLIFVSRQGVEDFPIDRILPIHQHRHVPLVDVVDDGLVPAGHGGAGRRAS